MRRLHVAIVALYPDAGHVVPLLKIGALLVKHGHEVTCLLPDECSALVNTYGLMNTRIGTALSPIALRASRGFGRRTIFAASFDVQYRDYYAAIFATSAGMVRTILTELRRRRPHLLLADNHQFIEISAAIGAELEIPVVFHDSAGGLHNRCGSLGVQVYGKKLSRPQEFGVLTLGFVYHLFCQAARHFRFRRDGLPRSTAQARNELQALLTKSPPSYAPHGPTSAGAVSPQSRRMRHHFAAGLGLLESRRLGMTPHPDRRSFGPIFDLPEPALPTDLAQWLESRAAHSVIYVSFGSMVAMSTRRLRVLLAVFGALDAPVLWALKGGRSALPTQSVPQTVRVEPFVPQRAVLAHPAVGACLTHGGIGTVLECFAAGTPQVVMPILWDQPYNAQFVHDLGAGIRLDWWNLKERTLADALRSILHAPEWRQRVRSLADELSAQNGSEEVLHFLEDLVNSRDSDDV